MSNQSTPAAASADAPQPRLGRRLHSALQQLWSSIDAIRHLDEHLAPRAAELDEDRLSPAALTAIASLSTERQEALRTWWEKTTAAGATSTEPPTATPLSAEPTQANVAEGVEPDSSTEPSEPDAADDELGQILGNRVVATEFVNHLVRTLGAPASAESIPRLASSVPPSTPKPAHRIFATATLAPLPGSTVQRACSIGPDNHLECGARSWLLDAVPIAKPQAALDVGLSAPVVRRAPPSPSSGSPYLALARTPEPLWFAKDLP